MKKAYLLVYELSTGELKSVISESENYVRHSFERMMVKFHDQRFLLYDMPRPIDIIEVEYNDPSIKDMEITLDKKP